MSAKNWIEVMASLAGGAGIGMGLMYLLDPDRGSARRHEIADAAERAWDAAHATLGATGDALGETWDGVSDRARGWGKHLSKRARSQASHLMDHASDARDAAGDWLDDTAHQARGYGNTAAKRLRAYAARAGAMVPYERHHAGSAASVAAGVVGALALGAGLMYILDPTQGRRRREQARDLATHYTHEAAEAVQKGAHNATDALKNGAQKAGDFARDAAQQVKQRVQKKTVPEQPDGNNSGAGANAQMA